MHNVQLLFFPFLSWTRHNIAQFPCKNFFLSFFHAIPDLIAKKKRDRACARMNEREYHVFAIKLNYFIFVSFFGLRVSMQFTIVYCGTSSLDYYYSTWCWSWSSTLYSVFGMPFIVYHSNIFVRISFTICFYSCNNVHCYRFAASCHNLTFEWEYE